MYVKCQTFNTFHVSARTRYFADVSSLLELQEVLSWSRGGTDFLLGYATDLRPEMYFSVANGIASGHRRYAQFCRTAQHRTPPKLGWRG